MALAFAIASLPIAISSRLGGVQSGCHTVIATPHWAIAHFGSFVATSLKTRRASS
jgi:hypothetical protein